MGDYEKKQKTILSKLKIIEKRCLKGVEYLGLYPT